MFPTAFEPAPLSYTSYASVGKKDKKHVFASSFFTFPTAGQSPVSAPHAYAYGKTGKKKHDELVFMFPAAAYKSPVAAPYSSPGKKDENAHEDKVYLSPAAYYSPVSAPDSYTSGGKKGKKDSYSNDGHFSSAPFFSPAASPAASPAYLIPTALSSVEPAAYQPAVQPSVSAVSTELLKKKDRSDSGEQGKKRR
ncbi:hypothetical protein ACA910_003365 [Epithemia clementina (nom. ined.)]